MHSNNRNVCLVNCRWTARKEAAADGLTVRLYPQTKVLTLKDTRLNGRLSLLIATNDKIRFNDLPLRFRGKIESFENLAQTDF